MKALLAFEQTAPLEQVKRQQGHARYLSSLRTDDIPGARAKQKLNYSLITSDIGAVPRSKPKALVVEGVTGRPRDTLRIEDIPGAHARQFRRFRKCVYTRPRDTDGLLSGVATDRSLFQPPAADVTRLSLNILPPLVNPPLPSLSPLPSTHRRHQTFSPAVRAV